MAGPENLLLRPFKAFSALMAIRDEIGREEPGDLKLRRDGKKIDEKRCCGGWERRMRLQSRTEMGKRESFVPDRMPSRAAKRPIRVVTTVLSDQEEN